MVWVVLTLCASFFFAAKDIVAKKILRQDTSPKQLFFEEFFLLLLISVIAFHPQIEFSSFIKYWDIYFLKAITIAIFTLVYFKLLKKYELSHVAPLLNLSPLILLLLSTTILSEVISPIHMIGILLIILSTYLLEITYHHHHHANPHRHHLYHLKQKDKKFYILVLIMLISVSFSAIYDKKIFNQGLSVASNLFFTGAIVFTFMLIYYLYEGHLQKVFKKMLTEPETLLVGILQNFSTILILFAISIPTAMVSLIVPLKRTSTLLSSVFGGLFFHEQHLKQKIIATIGMIIGIFLIVM